MMRKRCVDCLRFFPNRDGVPHCFMFYLGKDIYRYNSCKSFINKNKGKVKEEAK